MKEIKVLERIYKSPELMRRFWDEELIYEIPLSVMINLLKKDEAEFNFHFPLTVEDLINTLPPDEDELKNLKLLLINELTPRCCALARVIKKYE